MRLLRNLLDGVKLLLYILNAYVVLLVVLSAIHWINNNEDSSIEPLNLLFAAILSIISFLIRRLEKKRPLLGYNLAEYQTYFPKANFNERLQKISFEIQQYLEGLNQDADWGFEQYTDIEAEVEVVRNSSRNRKLSKLSKAIKQNQNSTFLILGEPGSGKSVSLRKLCHLFAQQTPKSKKIPLYINLKEWQIIEEEPTTTSLNNFIIGYIKGLDRPNLNSLLFEEFEDGSTYFDKYYQYGLFYFVFDSFDEIPKVLTADSNNIIIEQCTKTISRYIQGSSSKGILASRTNKPPHIKFLSNVTLNLLPFDDVSIAQTLEKYGISEDATKQIFIERPDLVQLLENPFSLMLFVNYFKENSVLPNNQAEMYQSFIYKSLRKNIEIYSLNITLEESVFQAENIAKFMFEKQKGFEISINNFKENTINLSKITDLLKKAKLGRGLIRDREVFGFVHRRFAEYFLVRNMINGNVSLDYESIPNMGQHRDSMALYTELATEEESKKIADYCVNQIIHSDNPLKRSSLNSLAFLVVAFQNRLHEVTNNFNPLFSYAIKLLRNSNDILVLKNYIEILKLMNERLVKSYGLEILKWKNSWLNETVIRCTRRLAVISDDFKREIKNYITDLEYFYFFKTLPNLLFSFSLNQSFKVGKRYCYLKIADLVFFLIVLSYFTYFEVVEVRYWNRIFENNDYLGGGMIILLILSITQATFKYGFRLNEVRFVFLMMSLGVIVRAFLTGKSVNGNWDFEIIILLLGVSFMGLRYMNLTYLNNLKLNYKDFLIPIIFVFIVIVFFFLGYYRTNPTNQSQILPKNLVTGIVVLLIGFSIAFSNLSKIGDYFKIKKIKKNIPKKREEVYKVLKSELKSDYFKGKYVKFLENNVQTINGEWPDRSLFIITNGVDYLVRLAKLEEKWSKHNIEN